MKLLKKVDIRDDIFDNIYKLFLADIVEVNSLDEFKYGYRNKRTIYYQKDNFGTETMILKYYIVAYYAGLPSDDRSWLQVIVRKVYNQESKAELIPSGLVCYNYINKVLSKYYSKEEIKEIFKSHSAEYDESKVQYHYNYPVIKGRLLMFGNTKKYDINGAHCDALCELFPKCANQFRKMTALRKKYPDNPKYKHYKCYFNFYVGYLAKAGFRGTYNWIVQRTTTKLLDAIVKVKGTLLYANTDGFVINDPDNLLTTSKLLGDFNEEYSGATYIYQGKNYWLMQQGKELKGSCRTVVRDKVDLSKGIAVEYDIVRKQISGKYYMDVENVREINIYEENSK